MSLLIQNCTLRGREGLWDVYCEGKSIAAIGQGLDRKADTTIDAKGNLLVPAFIDPHIHLDKVNILDTVRKNVSGTLTEAIEKMCIRDRDKLPKIFAVNWFRRGEDGHFLWPGFGENSRVLKWVVERCDGTVGANETAIGYMPLVEDLYLDGLDIPEKDLEALTTVNRDEWQRELEAIRSHFEGYGPKMPKELFEQLDAVEKRL